jgi:hypothetical protein
MERPSLFKNELTRKAFMEYLIEKKGFQFFIFFFISAIILFFSVIDPKFLTSRTTFYAILIIAPIVFGFYVSSKASVSRNTLYAFALMAVFLVVAGGCMYVIQNLGVGALIFNYLFYIMFLVILIIGLTIVYVIFSNAIKRQYGIAGFIVRFIFFIPCLVSDFLDYIRNEFKITPPVLVWLLILEILLLILQAYLPKILSTITYTNKTSLMPYPVFLNDPHTIATSERFQMYALNSNPTSYSGGKVSSSMNNLSTTENITYRNTNYAFSFWTYINPGNLSKTAYTSGNTNIFTFGDDEAGNTKPKVVYDQKKGLVVYFAGNDSKPYTIHIPNQAWVHVTLNYKDDRADLFINGALKYTHMYSDGIPPAGTQSDTVVVGQKNGLDGAIRDVRYFENAITSYEISNIYNTGFIQEPEKV